MYTSKIHFVDLVNRRRKKEVFSRELNSKNNKASNDRQINDMTSSNKCLHKKYKSNEVLKDKMHHAKHFFYFVISFPNIIYIYLSEQIYIL